METGFNSFQPLHFEQIGLVIQIITTKALNSMNLKEASTSDILF